MTHLQGDGERVYGVINIPLFKQVSDIYGTCTHEQPRSPCRLQNATTGQAMEDLSSLLGLFM